MVLVPDYTQEVLRESAFHGTPPTHVPLGAVSVQEPTPAAPSVCNLFPPGHRLYVPGYAES